MSIERAPEAASGAFFQHDGKDANMYDDLVNSITNLIAQTEKRFIKEDNPEYASALRYMYRALAELSVVDKKRQAEFYKENERKQKEWEELSERKKNADSYNETEEGTRL